MPRPPATADVFAAIAEPTRRGLISALGRGEPRPVNDLVEALKLPQPAVSKHLAILRDAGIVSVQRRGRHRLYTLNPQELKPVHAWVTQFERFWTHHLDRIKDRAERRAREQPHPQPKPKKEK